MKSDNQPDPNGPVYAYTHQALVTGGELPPSKSQAQTITEKKWYAGSFLKAKNWDDDQWSEWVKVFLTGVHQDFPPPTPKCSKKDYLLHVHHHLTTPDCRQKLLIAFKAKITTLGSEMTPEWVRTLPKEWIV